MPPKTRERPQVIQNARDENPNTELPPPTDAALHVAAQLNMANKDLMDLMKAFNKLLSDRTLTENKSSKEKENEQTIVNRLASSAMSVENLSPGQGLLGLCILAVRQALSLRDAGNVLAYKLHCLEEKVQKLDGSSNLPVNDDKQRVLELAKQLGLKVSIE